MVDDSCEEERTVSLCESPIDLPISLVAQSPLPSLDWIPGTTRGMVMCCGAVKRRRRVRESMLGFGVVYVEIVCLYESCTEG